MKKIPYILTSLVLAVSLTACGGQGHTPVSSEADTSSVSSEPAASAEPVGAETPVTLADLTEDQIRIFESISETNLDEAKQGAITLEELDSSHADLIEVYIVEGELPSNAHTLYDEWKDSIGYYNQFTGTNANTNANTNTNAGSGTNVDTSNPNTPSTEVPVVSGGNNANTNTSTKPKPSVPQQQQQVENNGGGMTQEEKEALAAEQAGKVEVNQSGGVIDHGPGADASAKELPDDLPDWITQGMQ